MNTTTRPPADAVSAPAASGAAARQLVTFEVAGETFAADVLAVQEINRMMDITRVPQSPPDVEGVINLRGRIVPVVDLRRRFGFPAAPRTTDHRVIVADVQGRVLAFIVDRVHEVLRVPGSIVEPAPPMAGAIDAEFIDGVVKLDDRLLILLNLSKLFGTEPKGTAQRAG